MILADHLSKRYGQFLAVDQVCLKIKPGEILVLLGPNGAGKTTTVRMLTSILKPTSGTASILGYDVVKDADSVRGLVGVLTEHHGLYGRMTPVEYLLFFGLLYNQDRQTTLRRINQLMEQFGLGDAKKKRLSAFSRGMRQKLALIRALIHDPPAVLLDEPTSALDPDSAHTVREAIRGLKSSSRMIMLCTHNLAEAEAIADKIAIIQEGKIILQGTSEDLKDQILGHAEYEVHLADPVPVFSMEYPQGVQMTARGSDWIRYKIDQPRTMNQALLNNLLAEHLPVTSFEEVPRSLEQVYLKAISRNRVED